MNDGGQAFSSVDSGERWDVRDSDTRKEYEFTGASGMSLRDYFAAKAMAAAMCSESNPHLAAARLTAAQRKGRTYEAHLAVEAYQIADAMLAQRDAPAAERTEP